MIVFILYVMGMRDLFDGCEVSLIVLDVVCSCFVVDVFRLDELGMFIKFDNCTTKVLLIVVAMFFVRFVVLIFNLYVVFVSDVMFVKVIVMFLFIGVLLNVWYVVYVCNGDGDVVSLFSWKSCTSSVVNLDLYLFVGFMFKVLIMYFIDFFCVVFLFVSLFMKVNEGLMLSVTYKSLISFIEDSVSDFFVNDFMDIVLNVNLFDL